MESLIIVTIYSYILGSIPFGLIFSKILGFGDIRKIGSGNIGATNALRTGSKKLAFLTLLFAIRKAGPDNKNPSPPKQQQSKPKILST